MEQREGIVEPLLGVPELDEAAEHVAHYKRLRSAAGPRVGLGSDLNGMVPRLRGSRACPCGVRHLGDWPAVEAALAAAGVKSAELSQSAEPFLTAWEGARALGGPACS